MKAILLLLSLSSILLLISTGTTYAFDGEISPTAGGDEPQQQDTWQPEIEAGTWVVDFAQTLPHIDIDSDFDSFVAGGEDAGLYMGIGVALVIVVAVLLASIT